MPAPLLSLLAPSLRLAFPTISAGVGLGLSANAILRVLTGAGLGVNRQQGLDLIREIRGTQLGMGASARGRMDSLVRFDRLPPSITRMGSRGSYLVEISGTLASTGERVTRNVWVASEYPLTKRQILDAAEGFMEAAKPDSELREITMTFKGGLRNSWEG